MFLYQYSLDMITSEYHPIYHTPSEFLPLLLFSGKVFTSTFPSSLPPTSSGY